VTPGYKRVRRPDDDVEPEVRWYRDGGEQQKLLTAVLTELRDAGFAGPRVAILSPSGDENCAAAKLTEQPWRDRLDPLVREPADDEAEDVGDWLAACIPAIWTLWTCARARPNSARSTASRAWRRRLW